MSIGFDATNPGDSDIVSQFPLNERGSRAAIASAWVIEHDNNQGRHSFEKGNTSARDAITSWTDGAIYANTSATSAVPIIQIYSSATAVWLDTGRFTPADKTKLDSIASGAGLSFTTATPAEMNAGTETGMRSMSPSLIFTAASAVAITVSNAAVSAKPTFRDFQSNAPTNFVYPDLRLIAGETLGSTAGPVTVTLPFTFDNFLGVAGAIRGPANNGLAVTVNTLTNSSFTIAAYDLASNPQANFMTWIAWGRKA